MKKLLVFVTILSFLFSACSFPQPQATYKIEDGHASCVYKFNQNGSLESKRDGIVGDIPDANSLSKSTETIVGLGNKVNTYSSNDILLYKEVENKGLSDAKQPCMAFDKIILKQ